MTAQPIVPKWLLNAALFKGIWDNYDTKYIVVFRFYDYKIVTQFLAVYQGWPNYLCDSSSNYHQANSKLNILTDTGDPIHYEKVVDKRHFKQNEVQQTKRSTFLLILRLLN